MPRFQSGKIVDGSIEIGLKVFLHAPHAWRVAFLDCLSRNYGPQVRLVVNEGAARCMEQFALF